MHLSSDRVTHVSSPVFSSSQITEREMISHFRDNIEALNVCPSSVPYDVDGRNMTEPLRLRIRVKNVTCINRSISFLLTSGPALLPTSKSLCIVSGAATVLMG